MSSTIGKKRRYGHDENIDELPIEKELNCYDDAEALEEINEEENDEKVINKKGVVFAFGRFQPPHKGHELLIKKVSERAAKIITTDDKYADAYIFISSTEGTCDNPLSVEEKKFWLEKMFSIKYPNIKFINTSDCSTVANNENCKNPFVLVFQLAEFGYKYIDFFAGSDRVPSYDKYKEKLPEDIEYNVISAGERNNNSTDITSMSATKMRKYAEEKNEENTIEFKKGVEGLLTDNDAVELMELLNHRLQTIKDKKEEEKQEKKRTKKRGKTKKIKKNGNYKFPLFTSKSRTNKYKIKSLKLRKKHKNLTKKH